MEPQNVDDVKAIVSKLVANMIETGILAAEKPDEAKQIKQEIPKQKAFSTSSGRASYNQEFKPKASKSSLFGQSKVKPKPSLPKRDPSTYEWKHTEPPYMIRAPIEACQRFTPRVKPRNYDVLVDIRVYQMQPTEYLIGYSNQYTSIGMIKYQEDIQGQPLTMQFGNWKIMDGKDLCVGSTVIVKSFAQMIDQKDNKLKDYATKYESIRDFMSNGSPYSNVQAVDWAIVNTPKIISSLGRIKEMMTEFTHGNYMLLTGTVYDYEYDYDLKVINDFWPMYIKEAPEKDSAVIIRWIEMKEPYNIFTGRSGISTILPEYARNYLDVEKRENNYIVGWIDTKFNHD